MRILLSILLSILLLLVACDEICSQDNWGSEGALGGATEIRHRAVGFSIGDMGYVGTGTRGFFGNTGYREFVDFWKYNPVTKVWTQLADVGTTGRYDAVGFSVGGKGYVATGRHRSPSQGVVYRDDVLEYDTLSNTWTPRGNILGGPRSGAVAFTIGNKAYVGTGFSPTTGNSKDFYEFTPSNSYTWTQKKPFEGVGREFAAGFSICDKGYIGTGLVDDNTGSADFWEYDPSTNDWIVRSDYEGGSCYGAKGFSICTRGYILKGAEDGICDSKRFWEYDPFSDSWIERASLPSVFRFHPVAFNINGKGYVGTGKLCGSETYYNDFLSYTPIEENIPDQPGEIMGSTVICEGAVQTYFIDVVSCALSYTWQVPQGSSLLTGQGSNSITVLLGSSSGNISVTAENDCGQSIERGVGVTVNPLPDLTITESSTICAGEEVQLQVSGAMFYSWTPIVGLNDPVIPNPIAAPTSTTTYQVIGTSHGCADTTSVTITVTPKPVVVAQGTAKICQGESSSLMVIGAIEYQWSPVTGLSDPNIPDPVAAPLETTTYTVIGTASGCSDTSSVTISVHPTPLEPVINGSITTCLDSEEQFSIEDANSEYTYHWMLPNGWGFIDLVGSQITTFAGQSGYLSAIAQFGMCFSDTTFFPVVVYTEPVPPEISGASEACKDSAYSYTVGQQDDADAFIWFIPQGWIVMDSTDHSISVIPDSSDVLSLAAVNMCDTSEITELEIAVSEMKPETPSVIFGNSAVCAGSIQGYTVDPIQGATDYEWSMISGWTPIGSVSGSTVSFIVGDQGGSLRVRARNACGESSFSEPIQVTVDTMPETSVSHDDPILTANAVNVTYQWVRCPFYDTIPGATNQSYVAETSGEYAVILNQGGCIDTSACYSVTGVGVNESMRSKSIYVYPNPTYSIVHISTEFETGLDRVSVYGSLGNQMSLMQAVPQSTSFVLDIGHLPAGVYLLVIEVESHRVLKRVVKL